MAISGVRNAANPYISAGVKDARATKAAKVTKEYYETQPSNAETTLVQEFSRGVFDDKQDSLDESNNKDKIELFDNSKTNNVNNFELNTSKPSDNSSELTKRLVAALGQFQVRQVISEANKSLMSLRMIAATSKGKDAALARAYIKKVEKVLSRANRKLDDLDKEDMLKFQQARAEKQKQEQRAEEIKKELRKKETERRSRENGYLLEDLQPSAGNEKYTPATNQKSKSEAAIKAQAEAIAAAEMATGNISSADGGGSGETAESGQSSADSGAEPATVECGESAE